MKTKLKKYTNTFEKVYDDGNKQIYIRNFGHVILENDETVNILVICEIYDLDKSGAVRIKELNDPEQPVMLTFSLLPELKYVSKKHLQSIKKSSGCGKDFKPTLVDVYDYMGGLRYEPSDKVWFGTNENAKEHILSKDLNDKILIDGRLSGFIMDQHYNRIGETNWSVLNKIMYEK